MNHWTDRFIADRVRQVQASGIRRVFELAAKLERPINLSIGQPDFPVPQPIQDAAKNAIDAQHSGYTLTQGIPQLREKIHGNFLDQYGDAGRWDDSRTLIISGVSGGLLLSMMCCVEPGDEVIFGDPYFVMYKQLALLAGVKPVMADTYPDFRLTAERVEPLITEKTRMIIVASPANPTGVVLKSDELEGLVRLCEKHDLLLLSDEIYDQFCFPRDTQHNPPAPSPAQFGDRMVVLRGYSKSYAMTGWRLGSITGPSALIEQMTKAQQYTFVCAPSLVQHAGLAADPSQITGHIAQYRKRRDLLIEKLSPHYRFTPPDGAFYAFIECPHGMTGMEFVEKAVEKNLLIIPGSVFSERDTHFRLSIACDEAMLNEGLDILIELAQPATDSGAVLSR